MNQLASVPTKLLNNAGAVTNNLQNMTLTAYLVEQINLIKKGSLSNPCISYDRLYEVAGLTEDERKDYNKTRRIRDNVGKILMRLEKDKLFKSFIEYNGQKNEVLGVKIEF